MMFAGEGGRTAYTVGPSPLIQQAVAQWPVRVVIRDTEPGHMYVEHEHLERDGRPATQAHLVCAVCDQSVACLSPDLDAAPYQVTPGIITSGVLAHLRVCHEDSLPST